MQFFKKKKKTIPGNQLPPDMVYSMEPRHGHAQDVYDENNIRQVAGCLPIDPVNKRFLLVTSSSNRGVWVIPKGGWEKDETQQQAAMRETWEEAGVKGHITRHIGVFAEKSKIGIKAHHWIYELEIKEVTKKFPEQKKRERRWFTYDEAMLVVKAPYIIDAFSMSSLSPLVHPYCESLQSDDNKKKEKKKKKKLQQQLEEEELEEAELEREKKEKKERKKQKKKEKKAAREAAGETNISDDDDDEDEEETKSKEKAEKTISSGEEEGEEKKKKKKKDKKKNKGEIVELDESEVPPLCNTTPLGKLDSSPPTKPVLEQENITDGLNRTHISPHLFPNSPDGFAPPPQQQFRPSPQQGQFRPPPPQGYAPQLQQPLYPPHTSHQQRQLRSLPPPPGYPPSQQQQQQQHGLYNRPPPNKDGQRVVEEKIQV